MPGPGSAPASRVRVMPKATSSAVTGSPVSQVASSRSWKVHSVKSLFGRAEVDREVRHQQHLAGLGIAGELGQRAVGQRLLDRVAGHRPALRRVQRVGPGVPGEVDRDRAAGLGALDLGRGALVDRDPWRSRFRSPGSPASRRSSLVGSPPPPQAVRTSSAAPTVAVSIVLRRLMRSHPSRSLADWWRRRPRAPTRVPSPPLRPWPGSEGGHHHSERAESSGTAAFAQVSAAFDELDGGAALPKRRASVTGP